MNPFTLIQSLLPAFCLAWLCLFAPAVLHAEEESAKSVDFASQVAPLLEQRCIRCHMPGNEKGDVSLATMADLLRQQYVVPGDPASSYLLDLVKSTDGQRPEMPQQGDPLTPDEVDLVRRWIAGGAQWPQDLVLREKSKADASWWSLQPLATGTIPEPANLPEAWRSHPLDRFIFAQLAEKGLVPNPPADRRTLIRRATYDLTGLPPTPAEVAEFLADEDPLSYEKLIDRLLESPRYGERWGRHWLDVVRFGESKGYERNEIINNAWPFRDYVINSLNADKPFDQFIREHLAGDVLPDHSPEQEIGSAFLVAGAYDEVKNQDPVQAAQIRANTIDEIIRATGEAFLGMTVGCARCHDHKFDPILQRDYYGLYATFAGVRHGARIVATAEQKAAHAAQLKPLREQVETLTTERNELTQAITARANENAAEHAARWTRPHTDRRGTEETFPAVDARFVRLVSEAIDTRLQSASGFSIDEFEVFSAQQEQKENEPQNVALATAGAKATGASRTIEDFPGAYGPQLAIDGKLGRRFIAAGNSLTIELAQPTKINRVLFSSARDEPEAGQGKFTFVAEYRIEISLDGQSWQTVADGRDRQPVSEEHRRQRLRELETTIEEKVRLAELDQELARVQREISQVPPLPTAWVGERVSADAQGPFHVFIGGSPQRPGAEVVPASFSAFAATVPQYELPDDAPESQRRQALADWIVDAANPLTPRVLANRLWHYHFGTGIVDTPSDFGYMGSRPTHPELLDWLATQVHQHGWRLKPLHKLIMLSQTYRQSSEYRPAAAEQDGEARLLWRFPPRRLSAEEIRDSLLAISGQLDTRMGGPGFRLYHYMQDNVATYVPLDRHGPETYRRAVYHQNARAMQTDLMSDFDQPDCAFSIAKRDETTTPLQALTMLNHAFTLDMAAALAQRVRKETGDAASAADQITVAYQLCYARAPQPHELKACQAFVQQYGLPALCRVLLNTSELIYLE